MGTWASTTAATRSTQQSWAVATCSGEDYIVSLLTSSTASSTSSSPSPRIDPRAQPAVDAYLGLQHGVQQRVPGPSAVGLDLPAEGGLQPVSSTSSVCASMYSATSTSNAVASIRRAPSRTSSSSSDTDGPPASCAALSRQSGTTVSVGVPSRPTRQRRPDRGPSDFASSPGRCAHSRHPAGDAIHRLRSLLFDPRSTRPGESRQTVVIATGSRGWSWMGVNRDHPRLPVAINA
jgi:hypothetical protein